jgi:hypothetical protein
MPVAPPPPLGRHVFSDKYRDEFPCKDPMPENPKPDANGISARATDGPATNDRFIQRGATEVAVVG